MGGWRGSDPTLLTVPLQGTADAVAQSDDRVEPEVAARATDVKRPALGEEVYTAPIDRRRDTERRADRLAGRARHPERPDRKPKARWRHVRHLSRDLHQLVEQGHFPAGEDVGPSGRLGDGRAQPE